MSNDKCQMNTTSPHNKRFKALWGEREPESSGTYSETVRTTPHCNEPSCLAPRRLIPGLAGSAEYSFLSMEQVRRVYAYQSYVSRRNLTAYEAYNTQPTCWRLIAGTLARSASE